MIKKTLHIFFSFILLVSFTWQCSAKTIIYVSFKSNQKKIAVTLCVNKNKPKSCCAGKCYLNKELKKEENRQSHSSSIKDKTEKLELTTGLIVFLFSPIANKIQDYKIIKSKSLPNNFLFSFFHPPSL